MLFPLKKLLEDKEYPLCIKIDETVKNALDKMLGNDFSQLLVIDNEEKLVGMITEKGIVRSLFHSGGLSSVMELKIDHCFEKGVKIHVERDIFEAIDLLEETYAIAVVDSEDKPVGILTNFDATHFLKETTEGLVIIQDIEIRLRKYIESILYNDNLMQAALFTAFGPDKKDNTLPSKQYNKLTLGQYINLITSSKNWGKFAEYFGPKDLFSRYMDGVREIRNQLTHFRGNLQKIQKDALKTTQNWLDSRPKTARMKKVSRVDELVDPISFQGFRNNLDTILNDPVIIKAGDVIYAIENQGSNQELPDVAFLHPSWWSNDLNVNPLSYMWLDKGWVVYDTDLNINEPELYFKKSESAYYQKIFQLMISNVKIKYPYIDFVEVSPDISQYRFQLGNQGIYFGWNYLGELEVEFIMIPKNQDYPKDKVQRIYGDKNIIESQLGENLKWDNISENQNFKIYIEKEFDIQNSDERIMAINWGSEMMTRFIGVFEKYIKD
jgi:CBS domain-containing protein